MTYPSRLIIPLILVSPVWAQRRLARDIFQELIETNTTHSAGGTTRAAQNLAARFRAAGFPEGDIQVLEAAPRKGNLIVRFRGTGRARPILFLGHLDVVEALRSDWSFDPFVFLEKDGYFYGRGTQDMKGDDALLIANFLRLEREGFQPARDLILALTADEEGGPGNGVAWLVKTHRELIDAAYCINSDAGGGLMRGGRHEYITVQAAEKATATFQMEATDQGGHSSVPRKDNPIYELAAGLLRLSKFDFPARLNAVTRASFERMASIEKGERAADLKASLSDPPDPAALARLSASPETNAQLRTTCVATMLSGGHASNALPQTAAAVVNCRILPADTAEMVERTLNEVIADPKIRISVVVPAIVSPVSVPDRTVLDALKQAASAVWQPMPVLTVMETGATDGKYLRVAGIPTYGVSGIFSEPDSNRAHGRDERIGVQAFYDGVEFMYRVIRTLAKSEQP